MITIEKIAVLGSGVMGSGIAAHIANAGIPVLLLDIVPDGAGDDRSKLARGAIERMLKTDPAPFMHPKNAALITAGNLEDDLEQLRTCDWIIEVVLEDITVKHNTYRKILPYCKATAILSSNTSSIPLHDLISGLEADVQSRFMITHFFNPPRYMRLLELVTSAATRPDIIAAVTQFCDSRLGKGVVPCNDTPGFIANRIGAFWMEHALNTAIDMKLTVEEADSLLSKPIGVPKTGVFGLIDLIGIDLIPRLAKSLLSRLPTSDAHHAKHREHALINEMIAAGFTGRKGKGGFYRMNKAGTKKTLEQLDLTAASFSESAYKPEQKPKLPAAEAGKQGLKAVVTSPDIGGQFVWYVMSDVLVYTAALVPSIAGTIEAVDEAMRLGYNWKQGPFEMIDALGTTWFRERLAAEGKAIPPLLAAVGDGPFYKTEQGRAMAFGVDGTYHAIARADGVLLLSDIKRTTKPVHKTGSANVWDVGDGVLCLEFTGKMNALDDQVFAAIHAACDMIEDSSGIYKALVVYNEGSVFSAGANLGLALFAMNIALWPQIEALVAGGQDAYKRLKYAPFPVVSAPSGLALGGGCEILLHSDHVQAHAELYCGLVEVGVGVIPAWGGCKEMLQRYYQKSLGNNAARGPMTHVREAFETIGTAKVAKSAADARDIGYLRATDGITMNRDRLLFDAKAKSLALAADYHAPEPKTIPLPGPSGHYAMMLAVSDLQKSGKATPYDGVVSDALARVLSGGPDADPTQPVDEDTILRLEREAFVALVKNEGTLARIETMLDTGKPLRN